MIVPADMVDAFCSARVLMDRHSPNANRHLLATFKFEGRLERRVRKVPNVHADRWAQLIETLGALFPKGLAWMGPGDRGMRPVLWLAEGMDDRAAVELAAMAGVAVRAGSPMFTPGTARPGLVLGFGGLSSGQMMAAAQRVAAVIAWATKSRRRKDIDKRKTP